MRIEFFPKKAQEYAQAIDQDLKKIRDAYLQIGDDPRRLRDAYKPLVAELFRLVGKEVVVIDTRFADQTSSDLVFIRPGTRPTPFLPCTTLLDIDTLATVESVGSFNREPVFQFSLQYPCFYPLAPQPIHY